MKFVMQASFLLVASVLSASSMAAVYDRGCVRSSGECRASCQPWSFIAELDQTLCLDPMERFHCQCVVEDITPPTPPADAFFVGCRPSAGECKMSCEGRNGIAQADEQLCPISEGEPFACYCPR